jgi:hypothetical protein
MRLVRTGLIVAAIAVTAIASPASAQRVVRQNNGDLNVEFGGPCTVHYNGNGRFQFADRSCSYAQRNQADYAIRSYVGGGYRPNYPNGGIGGGDFRITDIRWDRVRFADNCRVYYDQLGRHLRSDGGCNSRQRSLADNAHANWRRQSGYYPGGGGWYPGGQWNDINLLPSYDGGLHIRFRDGCDVYYNRYGNRVSADRKCSMNQRARADQAARYYRPGYNY